MYGCAKAAYSKAFTRVMTSKGKMEDDVDFWVPLLEKGKVPHFFTTIYFTAFFITQHTAPFATPLNITHLSLCKVLWQLRYIEWRHYRKWTPLFDWWCNYQN